ncbi:hypothetical protein Hanom_Chr09g00772741 [Helianthus anomalus]
MQTKAVPVVETEMKTSDDDYVEITGFKAASPKPVQQDIPESSHQKEVDFNFDFDDLGTATSIFSEDLPEGDSDMFNDKAVKELIQRVNKLEKEKAKTELEWDILKKQVDLLMKGHDQLREELMQQNEEIKELENVNQTLNQLLNEMSEASSNEMKAMKLEMEAMKVDKVMKDQQLQMLVAVVESHLKMIIHAAFEEIDVIKANERRMERERCLLKKQIRRIKACSSSQQHAEMTEVVEVQEQVEDDQEMVKAEEPHEPEFLIVGEPSEPVDVENIIRRVEVIQRKRKVREVLLLEWKTDKFVLVGNKSDDKADDKSDKDDKDDDDSDQGASRLLIKDPAVQEKVDELMNNEIIEQEDEVQNEASSFGKQPVDQVLLSNPTVIYLNAQQQGEVEVRKTMDETLEELGLEDGKFRFDIEDEIPHDC